MMAFSNATPQMQLSSTQISSIWNGVRSITARARVGWGTSNNAANMKDTSASKLTEKTRCSSQDEVEAGESVIGIPICVNYETLEPHWRESHKSHNSFQQNIDGSRMVLKSKVQEVCSAVLGSKQLRFSPALVNEIIYQQTRGFKTRRSESSGIVSGRHVGKIDTVKVPASSANMESEMFTQALPMSGESEKKIGLSKFLSSVQLSPEQERKVKISFADGFHAGSDWRVMQEGFNSTKGNPLRTQAFFEGYKCHSAATMPRDSSKAGFWSRFASSGLRFVITTSILVLVYLLWSPNVSIKKVSFLNGDQFEVNPETVTVTFDDVRGLSEAKAELSNIVDFLQNPSKYTDLGAKLPNGCLLVGPPGVGKTLLAKAVAGEAGVPFFQASGAEFDEIYVGTGAKRVRQLFQTAKAKAPCVIFIDEIDSVGSKRTSSEMHPYANQTVNQLLTEMDGFERNEGVIVLGATNKKSNLDKALLRPGRFDVEVSIRVPDFNERKDILALYLPKIVTDGQVDVSTVAKRTTGCTGADLNNICNHAAMKAATDGNSMVTMKDVEFAIDKIRMGPQKKKVLSSQVNKYTAYHEAGHAIMQYYSNVNTSKLHKITILPRGGSLGMTHFIHEERREFQYTREEMLDDLDAAMGGRVAEEMTFGESKVSTGASSDMELATGIATSMVTKYGFSDKIGLRVHSSDDPVSERVKEEMDEEIKKVLKDSYERCKKLLMSKQKQMNLLAEALLEHEELTYEEAKIVIEGGTLNKYSSSAPSSTPPSDKGSSNPNKISKIGTIKPIQL